MRIKLRLKQGRVNQLIPINYQYALSSFIYHTIESSDSEYSEWLHSKGYNDGIKKFKLFTFSMLNIPKRNLENGKLRILSEEMELTVSMLSDKTMEHLIIGMFENQKMKIYDKENESVFYIKTVEQVPEPVFKKKNVFKTISPIVLTQRTIHNGKESQYYMSPLDNNYINYLENNLKEKLKIYYKEEPDRFKLDSFKVIGDVKTKLIKIKEDKSDMTEIRGFIFKFEITGDTELIRMGYEAGFGKSCSLGFGCMDLVSS